MHSCRVTVRISKMGSWGDGFRCSKMQDSPIHFVLRSYADSPLEVPPAGIGCPWLHIAQCTQDNNNKK